MRTLINYLRSCFCKHEFKLLKEIECYHSEKDKLPAYRRQTYMCPKCGYVKKIRL
jgi:rubrerythrin